MAGVRNTRSVNRQRWREHIEAWRDNGLSQQVYCARHELVLSSFQRWRRVFRGEAAKTIAPDMAGRFVPVRPVSEPQTGSGVVLVINDALRIEVAVGKDQLKLFDEAELEALIGDLETEVEQAGTASAKPTPKTSRQDKPKRRPLPAHLKRVERIIDLSEADRQALGEGWVRIGYDTSEQLAVIPRQYYVIHTKRAKYAPLDDGAGQGIRIAPRPDQILPKSIAHSSVIGDVVVAKFADGLPLYRQEKIFAREGIDLSRQSMSGWIIQLHQRLNPLMQALKEALRDGRVIHIDETRLQVLNEPDRDDTQQSWMWVYREGPPDKPVVWFQYAETHSGEVPRHFLFPDEADRQPFYILTDGYSGYGAVARTPAVLGHAGCWGPRAAQVRRDHRRAQEHRGGPPDGGVDRQAVSDRAHGSGRGP